MHTPFSFYQKNISDKIYQILLFAFLLLLGSHFLDYHLYIFSIFALFLVRWKYLTQTKSIVLVAFFILSMYITWVFLDNRLLTEFTLAIEVFSHGILIFLMYLLGLSINIKHSNLKIISDRSIFYILFLFIISYSFFVFWSYLTIKQDNPLNSYGMFVSFPNPYERAHVNGGRLISTILTYYLTLMTFILPLIVFYFSKLKKQGFYVLELILLTLLAISILYLTAMMGRRTTFVLFSLVVIFLLFVWMVPYLKTSINLKKYLFLGALISILAYGIFNFLIHKENHYEIKSIIVTENMIISIVEYPKTLQEKIDDIPIYKKLTTKGISDHRFTWWSTALKVMIEHPFGGGNGVFIVPGIRLAHNTWIDIGKDFGVIPFILFLMVTLLHLYYLIRIFFSTQVENLLKYQLVIIAIGIFGVMMIEPVFTSDKTFFAYIFFYLGIVCNVYVRALNPKKEISHKKL